MAEELRFIAGPLPQVAVGDYNCSAGSDAWKHLVQKAGFRDAWTAAGLGDEGVTTFNAFTRADRLPLDRPAVLKEWIEAMVHSTPQFAHYPAHVMEHRNYRIDWIMLRNGFEPRKVAMDASFPGGVIPSDHFPIVAELEWT
jgi:endonuclease/exonuclease/phosphatase family metal-dependent hydrolase